MTARTLQQLLFAGETVSSIEQALHAHDNVKQAASVSEKAAGAWIDRQNDLLEERARLLGFVQ